MSGLTELNPDEVSSTHDQSVLAATTFAKDRLRTAWCLWVLCWTAGRLFGICYWRIMKKKFTSLREAKGIGRPLGTADFVIERERRLGTPIARCAPGRKVVATPVGKQLNMLQSASCHRMNPIRISNARRR